MRQAERNTRTCRTGVTSWSRLLWKACHWPEQRASACTNTVMQGLNKHQQHAPNCPNNVAACCERLSIRTVCIATALIWALDRSIMS